MEYTEWEIEPVNGSRIVSRIICIKGGRVIATVNEAKDAPVIKAAPAMYEALEELRQECNKIGFPLGIKPASLVTAQGKAIKALAQARR